MAEDWAAIAAEIDEAIRSVGDLSQPNGYPVTLRIPGATTGPIYDPVEGPPVYKTLHCVEGYQEIRDQAGTLIAKTKHTLTVTAKPDAIPLKSHKLAIGVDAEDATEDSQWVEIAEVRPLSPAGVAVLYDIDLVD
jgi:hypothetical protein